VKLRVPHLAARVVCASSRLPLWYGEPWRACWQKNLFRQCSQRTTRIRCTNNPKRVAGTSGRVRRMGYPIPSRNCATALFANTVEIGRACTRMIPHYFTDTNLLKITCSGGDAPNKKPGSLASNRAAGKHVRVSCAPTPPGKKSIPRFADLADLWASHTDTKRAKPRRSRWGCGWGGMRCWLSRWSLSNYDGMKCKCFLLLLASKK
jgi:hypothetical protein